MAGSALIFINVSFSFTDVATSGGICVFMFLASFTGNSGIILGALGDAFWAIYLFLESDGDGCSELLLDNF